MAYTVAAPVPKRRQRLASWTRHEVCPQPLLRNNAGIYDRGYGVHRVSDRAHRIHQQLAADNSKAFWLENKHRFVEYVKAPMLALTDELADFGPFHMFRPHNDLRFSKNKPPYKTHQGAYGELEAGSGYYMQFSSEGLMAGVGYYSMAKDQLKRFRDLIDADATGEELAGIVAAMRKNKFDVTAIDELKTAPRGYPKDHPRVELLRMKGCLAAKQFGAPNWIHTKGAANRIREMWEGSKPLTDWLDSHVGPSTEAPSDRPF